MKTETKQRIEKMKLAAKQGEVKSLYDLGQAYDSMGDFDKSFYWYQKSAEQGNIEAQLHIGLMYSMGEGVKKDFSKSLYWVKKSAQQGCSEATFILGTMYEAGHGVKKNLTKAIILLKKAAAEGSFSAALMLVQNDYV